MEKVRERILPPLVWIGIWQAGSAGLGSSLLLASPLQVARHLIGMLQKGQTWQIMVNSTAFVLLGFTLSLLLAVPCAVAAYHCPFFRRLTMPPVRAMRSVPVASFIILALVFISSKYLSILIAFTVSFPLFFIELLAALGNRDRALAEVSVVFGIPWPERVWRIDLPQILPGLSTSCRTATGVCWKAAVAAEIIGIPRHSIGEQMHMAKLYLDTAELFSWTVLILLLSALFEYAVQWLIRKLEKSAAAL